MPTKYAPSVRARLPGPTWAASPVVLAVAVAVLGCHTSGDIAAISYQCGTTSDPTAAMAGNPGDCSDVAGVNVDALLPPEPTLPADPTDPTCTIKANQVTDDVKNWLPDETNVAADTMRVVNALVTCKVLKLVPDGANNSFVIGPIQLRSAILWIDAGVTLFASRDPVNYQSTGNCGVAGVNDSQACANFITVSGTSPGIVGDGIIDGQGGEPLVGHDYSWWQLSGALQLIDGSIGNPTLINLSTGTSGFLLYRITLHNSPKFHVKITSQPPGGSTAPCTPKGSGYTVWGLTILTPSRWLNSQGLLMSPHFSRNTDGVDPGETSIAYCGVIAHSSISTGDDHIALKGGHWVSDVIIAHNHFGTGHGMSIGSETYGTFVDANGTHHGVENVSVCDLTIDADSRPVGDGASPGDFNGIRVKSDTSRGGIVNNVTFQNVCMRDVTNAVLISTAYNPLFAGTMYPMFQTLNFRNIHDVTCMSQSQAVVTLNGFSAAYPAGPITLDNVIVDNIGPQAVSAEFSSIVLGPGDVNFTPQGENIKLTDMRSGGSTPTNCVFPVLPAPQPPPGWLR